MATSGIPLWSTTAASNSTADPAVNLAEGMAASAVNDSVRAIMASVAKWRNDLYGITTGGTSTAFTIATGSTFATAAEMSGAIFTIIMHTTSGTAPTLAVDGLTARAINQSSGVATLAGALVIGAPYLVKYAHASTEFILIGKTSSVIPIGALFPYAGATAPTGYLLCNGASVLRASYPALLAVIGSAYGAVDADHFSVPDLTGRVPAGKEATASRLTTFGSGIDGATLGAVGGGQSHILTQAQLPTALGTASSVVTDLGHAHTEQHHQATQIGVAGSGTAGALGNYNTGSAVTGITVATTITNASGGNAHPNCQPTIICNYIIFAGV